MLNVRRAKRPPLVESIADLIHRYDLDAIARYDRDAIIGDASCAHSLAMPCSTVTPSRLKPVKRTIRFDDN
eukprot:7972563-Heterocapsa_arctica.AAC.1